MVAAPIERHAAVIEAPRVLVVMSRRAVKKGMVRERGKDPRLGTSTQYTEHHKEVCKILEYMLTCATRVCIPCLTYAPIWKLCFRLVAINISCGNVEGIFIGFGS